MYEVTVEKVQVNTVNELAEEDTILSSISALQRFDDISHSDYVVVCGTEYRSNMVIVVDVGYEPTFCRIVKCFMFTDNNVYFLCQNLFIRHYDSHLHAYIVDKGTVMPQVLQSKVK